MDENARGAGMVDLGHRPYLFSDRRSQPSQRGDQLVVDLYTRSAQRASDYTGAQRAGSNGIKLSLCRSGDDAVTAIVLGAIERLIGALEDVGDVLALGLKGRYSD